MADLPPGFGIEPRLREFLDDELRRAEIDFVRPQRSEIAPGRRGLPVGLLAAAIAVLVFAVVGPRVLEGVGVVGPGSTDVPPSPSALAAASVAPSPPAPSSPPASASPVATAAPSDTPPATASPGPGAGPSETPPAGITTCRRLPAIPCERAVALARAVGKADVAGATRIVVDDTCAPGVLCDRQYPFDSIVVFATAGGDTTGWYAYHVVGPATDEPTMAKRWEEELPSHIVQLLLEPRPTP